MTVMEQRKFTCRRPTRPRVFEEDHILIGQVISEIVEQELFDEKGRVSGS
jgi:hypothetical protein